MVNVFLLSFYLGHNACLITGLIAAASGQLNLLLQRSCGIISLNSAPRCTTNGVVAPPVKKLYPVKKPLKSLVNGFYANGNGIHI